jgi:hypothetical protein
MIDLAVISLVEAQGVHVFADAGQVAVVDRIEAVQKEDVNMIAAILGQFMARLDHGIIRRMDRVQTAQAPPCPG